MAVTVFQNEGELDVRAIKTFGVSAKGGNTNAIGFFGTGLKYAIAIMLRHGIKFSIHVGQETYKFSANKQTIRGEDFNIVTMNGEELGFTSDVGKTWELWQAFRELYCNCIDEGGDIALYDGLPEFSRGCTTIIVHGDTFAQLYRDRGDIILQSKPLYFGDSCELHEGESANVFYRTIRAFKFHLPTLYTYNVLASCAITEDRTLTYDFQVKDAVLKMVVSLTDKKILSKLLTASDMYQEHTFDYSALDEEQISEEFLEVVGDLKKNKRFELNNSASALHTKLTAVDIPIHKANLNEVESEQLKRALDFCTTAFGYEISTTYELLIADNLGDHILGAAKDEKIYLSRKAFEMGTKMLAGTLAEEYIHLKYGYADCCREMQNYLLDKMVSLGEQLLGKPI